MQVEELADAPVCDAGSLADLSEGQALDKAQAEQLEVARAGSADRAPIGRQHQATLIELADYLVQLGNADGWVFHEFGAGIAGELFDVDDAGGVQAEESGRTEAQLGDTHGGTASDADEVEQVEVSCAARRTDVLV